MLARPSRSTRWQCAAGLWLGLLASQPIAMGQTPEDDEPPEFVPGLVARYERPGGRAAVRRELSLAHKWDRQPPDRRLPPGDFRAVYRGFLLTRTPGKYRLRLYAAGRIQLKLNGEVLLDSQSDEPAWHEASAATLSFGYHPLEINFTKTGPTAALSLFWTGPDFPTEPVMSRWLFHKPADAPSNDFTSGQQLVRALRCAACHTIAGEPVRLSAPALDRLAGNLSRRWIVDRLAEHESPEDPNDKQSDTSDRRMPNFALTKDDAAAIAALLVSGKSQAPSVKRRKSDPKQGAALLVSLGCLACHRVGELGTAGLFGGGDLSQVGKKRPASYFDTWLASPEKLNRDHRMPVFRLETQERADLAAYLATLGASEKAEYAAESDAGPELIARGRELVEKHRCGACHTLPKHAAGVAVKRSPISAKSNWPASCTGNSDRQTNRPGYSLANEQRRVIEHFVSSLAAATEPRYDGKQILVERNCTACHRRGLKPGIAALSLEVAKAHPRLSSLVPALRPPALDGVGDKLHDKVLRSVITGKEPARRPWLNIRMPKFPLSEAEAGALVDHLIQTDRIPDLPLDDEEEPKNPAVISIAGARLVTADGFGCTSCHAIGKVQPTKVELKSHGANLSMLGGRIRRQWYDRWMHDPARIVPRMEMPAVKIPIRGVLKSRIDDQLAAVWTVLNQSGFEPPEPNPVRVIRRRNEPDSGERSLVVTDNLETPGQNFTKPLLIVMPNRHNVLFDQQRARLAGWWIGDAARQRTRGKYWYLEAAGTPLLPTGKGPADVVVLRKSQRIEPEIDQDLPPTFDHFEHVGAANFADGVAFQHRLSYPGLGDQGQPVQVVVRQRLLPSPNSEARFPNAVSGFTRYLLVGGLPPGTEVEIRALPADDPISIDARRQLAATGGVRPCRVLIIQRGVKFASEKDAVVRLAAGDNGQVAVAFRYWSMTPVDQFLRRPPRPPEIEPQRLAVVPGFDAVRLPIPDEIMPTGLAWRKDGRLMVTSLKNRVWQIEDYDNDGLEERARPFGDEYLTPYGVAVRQLDDGREVVDIVDKSALLRLYDDDNDGFAERTETLADGWGHSTDYHGWVTGLPTDEKGNYYLAVSQRGGSAAHLRGRVLMAAPREPTENNPRRFALTALTAGHRYPIGIARTHQGELFVTDNQGNFNPFNELNHVEPGFHYGFVFDKDARQVTDMPRRGPAIAIPHPWTRSVNGIAFLETPPALRKALGRDIFGPFEGHLVGCEYDTRRLIRISLQKVGDRYQGAAYPFSLPPAKDTDSFLGPIVCQVAPSGELYVGGLRDSAWGAGRNSGELVQLRYTGKLPAGIAEVRSVEKGLLVKFTQPVDAGKAAQRANYAIESYRRIPTPAYGGPDKDRRNEKIVSIEVAADAQSAAVRLDALRPGHVYELRIKNLTADGSLFHPAEAHFSFGPMPQ